MIHVRLRCTFEQNSDDFWTKLFFSSSNQAAVQQNSHTSSSIAKNHLSSFTCQQWCQ